MEEAEIRKLIRSPWFKWALVILALLVVLFISSSIRLSNLPLLIDQTTGEEIPIALDPFYFLRVAQTYVANDGNMPKYDELRYNPIYPTEWHHEMHPYITANVYMFLVKYNPNLTLEHLHNISPVVYFIIGLVIFFAICFLLTKNKWLAILASTFLAFAPAYLYRTMAGFSDHESIGMTAFFFALLIFIIAITNVGRKKDSYWKTILFGALLGFATTLTIASWTGVSNFLFIIFPISFFLIWLFNATKKNTHFIYNFILFYFSWIIFSVLLGPVFNFSFTQIFNIFQSSNGIMSLGVLAFIIIDAILILKNFEFIKQKYRVLYSIAISIVVGSIGLFSMGRNLLSVALGMISRLIMPFGEGRIGVTVAENKAPFLSQWIGQTGDVLFWMFILGVFLFGYQLSRRIQSVKYKPLFLGTYILMICGIVFSKYAPTSILNGNNFISIAFYLVSLVAFGISFFYIFFNEKFKWTKLECVIFALIFFTIISGRAAARVFFLITPFVCFMAAYFVINLIKEWKISKDKTLRLLLIIFFIIALFFSYTAINQSYESISNTAKYTGPSANAQWQGAMQWVRDNTSEDSVFVHWWDYGYWVESLGQRRTVADGGHFQGAEDGNHKIGRYVLTTQRPETALSYFKSMNIDYLLIDQTELGKYSAYSRIGSDANWDRFSVIPIGTYDPRQVKETSNETITTYNVQGMVDEDIEYDYDNDGRIDLLPGPTYDSAGNPSYNAYLAGIFFKRSEDSIKQPEAVYIYNNQQYQIPLRYVYINGELLDFKTGLDAVISVIPSLGQRSIDPFGAIIYLSPKVSKGLYAQLYLLNDTFNNYPTIKLEHSELDPVVKQIKAQGYNLGDIIYYQGFRGPIKIWNTQDIPEEINVLSEFPERLNGNFAGLDDLEFSSK